VLGAKSLPVCGGVCWCIAAVTHACPTPMWCICAGRRAICWVLDGVCRSLLKTRWRKTLRTLGLLRPLVRVGCRGGRRGHQRVVKAQLWSKCGQRGPSDSDPARAKHRLNRALNLWSLGESNPCLTRQNTDFPAVSFHLVPVRSHSLPAVSFSGLDGVKSGHQLSCVEVLGDFAGVASAGSK
jgi:hypothetical protein